MIVTLDVPVTKSEMSTENDIMNAEMVVESPGEKEKTICVTSPHQNTRPKRGGAKNAGVVGKKSQAPIPSSDEDSTPRGRSKRKGRGGAKSDSESPNKKADMDNCFGFESDVSIYISTQ